MKTSILYYNNLRGIVKVAMMIMMVIAMVGCKTSSKSTASLDKSKYLSAKVQLTIPNKDGSITINGTMKLIKGERIQLSMLMPILRNEIVRIDVSPTNAIVIDRMNKIYVQASKEELKEVLPKRADYESLEKMLFDAAKPEGKKELTGSELKLKALEGAKVVLSDFSGKEVTINPSEAPQKYRELELEQIIKTLKKQ